MSKRLLTALAPFAVAVLLVAIFMAARWPFWQQSLMSDQSPAAWLSSAQLLGACFLCFRLGLDRTLSPRFSAWLTAAMLVMALDEQFMLHEQWKYGCADWFAACGYGWVRELPMIAVAVIGAPTLARLARRIVDRTFRGVLFAGLAVGLIALGVDLAEGPEFLAPFEEAFEVVAEALFIGALLIATPTSQVHSPKLS